MNWRILLLILVCAALTFGGSFTCTSGDVSVSTTHRSN